MACSEGGQDLQEQKAAKCVPLRQFASVASRGEESEKLENTMRNLLINKFTRLSRDWVGAKICVFWGHSFWGEKSGVWRRGEIGKGRECNTWPRWPHPKHVWNIPSHNLLQTNYCTRSSRKNAIVLRPLQAIASHELLRLQTTAAATPLVESTPSSNSPKKRINKIPPNPGQSREHSVYVFSFNNVFFAPNLRRCIALVAPYCAIPRLSQRYPPIARYGVLGQYPPSAILSRKGIARYGGLSRTGPLSALPKVCLNQPCKGLDCTVQVIASKEVHSLEVFVQEDCSASGC